jgi:hypothetical protein
MRAINRFFLLALVSGGGCALPAQAVEPTLAPAGFTGLGITPNARLLGWGQLGMLYDRQMPGIVSNPGGHNFIAGFGLLPNLEVAGRLATSTIHDYCRSTQGCGAARDLSASGKLAIGLDAANRFSGGVGVTDVGGAATNFRSYYGVVTYHEGPWEASLGYAQRSSTRGNMAPLDGVFGGAAWQPLSWVRGHVEYTDSNAWAGVRLFAPQQWLPEGWAAYMGANLRLTDTNFTERSWFTAGLTIPLYKTPALPSGSPKAPLPPLEGAQQRLPAYEARNAPAPAASGPASPAPAAQARAQAPAGPAAAPRPVQPAAAPASPSNGGKVEDKLLPLLAELKSRGFEDISVGQMPDRSVAIRVNNATYNWNAADALGVALGSVARALGDGKTAYRLVMTQRQIPLVAVTGQTDCLAEWVAKAESSCAAGELSTPGTGPLDALHDGAAWAVQGAQPSRNTLRVALSPVLRTTVGTELGAYDYSLGANVGLAWPVWAGGSLEFGYNVALAESDDFEAGAAFGNRRVRTGVERVAFVQTWRLPMERWYPQANPADVHRLGLGAVTAQASVGRFGMDYDGIHGVVRWEPGQGLHRVTAQAGWFHNNAYANTRDQFGPRTAVPVLASYRYALMPTRTYLEATAGQFMNNDRGFQIGMRQWFSDVSVGAYYKRTQFDGASARQLVGVELSVPIGPRKDMSPGGPVQVTGTPRFAHAVETVVRDSNNAVRPGHAALPPTPNLETVFNSDRASLLYFEDNIRRIRDAAR